MSLRARLMLLFTITIVLAVAGVTFLVTATLGREFAQAEQTRSEALAERFRAEFESSFQQVESEVRQLAASDPAVQMAVQMGRAAPDFSRFAESAAKLAPVDIDFFELLTPNGVIISSKNWPARFGYREAWFNPALNGTGAFLQTIEQAQGSALAVMSLERMTAGDQNFYIAAGRLLGSQFLNSFNASPEIRVFLVPSESQTSISNRNGNTPPAIQSIAAKAAKGNATLTVHDADETIHAFPLRDPQQNVAAVLLVTSSRAELEVLNRKIMFLGLVVGVAGILFGILVSAALAAQFTRPIEELARAADAIAAGDFKVSVDQSRADELGRLGADFNRMTQDLAEQRQKLIQAERVAAWRELARRLAHELKNPLFPLQITVENLLRAREQQPEQFDEVFNESAQTLLAELKNLNSIIGRFSDFSKMPTPEPQVISINETLRKAVRVYEPNFCAKGRPLITARWELDPQLEPANTRADPELLHRALSNLILNAMDAMPTGGYLLLRTKNNDGTARIEIVDSGTGISTEERERLFTPYHTSKEHGTGLGLAIVQSVVSDHRGKVWAESETGKGSTFIIELPMNN